MQALRGRPGASAADLAARAGIGRSTANKLLVELAAEGRVVREAGGRQPPPMAPLDVAGSSTSALAMLPEVLTAREAAAILRVGRNQLYQAVARGQLGVVRIGRSIHIPQAGLAGPAHRRQSTNRQR